MHRLWPVGAIVAAGVVLGVAVYVLDDHTRVPNAGQVVGYSPPPSSPPPSSPSQSSPPPSHPPAVPALVVAFLGDDYTAGTRASTTSARFSTLVSTALDLTERNFGVAGSGYANPRGGGDYQSRVGRVVAAKPDVVVVSGGRNDVIDDPDTVASNASDLFAELHARLPHAVLVAVAPFWGDSPPRPLLATIAASIKSAVLAVGGRYMNLPDPLRGHPKWMADQADPNDAGYAAIAKAIKPVLAASLPPRA